MVNAAMDRILEESYEDKNENCAHRQTDHALGKDDSIAKILVLPKLLCTSKAILPNISTKYFVDVEN